MSTILVTGATGVLGREVVQQLLDRQHQVRIFTHRVQPDLQGLEMYQGDLQVGTGLLEATRGVDAIIHCATIFGGTVTDLEATRHLIEAALANGKPHLVYISIVGIDRITYTYYQIKLEVERLIEQADLPWTIVRTTQFHDLALSIITSGEDESGAIITIPSGVRFQTIDAGEVARSLVELAEQAPAGHVPDMGGPQVLTLEEMTETYRRVYNKQHVIRVEPLEGGRYRYNTFRTTSHMVPERAVGRVTWEAFLRRRV